MEPIFGSKDRNERKLRYVFSIVDEIGSDLLDGGRKVEFINWSPTCC